MASTSKKIIVSLWIGVMVLMPISMPAQAAINSFTIAQQVVGDNDAPTIPVNVAATAISSSQIDVSWDASTDNAAVAGYQVFRDTVFIATTTLTAYSDIGLSASTTYSYTIAAFDVSLNVSGQSSSSATTTFAAVIEPEEPEATTTTSTVSDRSGRSDTATILYTTGETFIDFDVSTRVATRINIRWGRTSDYELGYIESDILRTVHRTRISGLMPGLWYEVEVSLSDRFGRNIGVKTFRIKTNAGPDITAPPNVQSFTARTMPDEVLLTWINPQTADFSRVRVMSSDYFPPVHDADGWLVYDGVDERVRDTRPLIPGVTRYYTIFSYDQDGNRSSGAVAYVTKDGVSILSPGVDIIQATSSDSADGATLLFSDVTWVVDNQVVNSSIGIPTFAASTPFSIVLPYELLPEHLKTIIVTLTHPSDTALSFSFLMSIDADKENFVSHLSGLPDPGVYQVQIDIFDHYSGTRSQVRGSIEVTPTSERYGSAAGTTISYWWLLILLNVVALAIVGYMLWWLMQKKRLLLVRSEDSSL